MADVTHSKPSMTKRDFTTDIKKFTKRVENAHTLMPIRYDDLPEETINRAREKRILESKIIEASPDQISQLDDSSHNLEGKFSAESELSGPSSSNSISNDDPTEAHAHQSKLSLSDIIANLHVNNVERHRQSILENTNIVLSQGHCFLTKDETDGLSSAHIELVLELLEQAFDLQDGLLLRQGCRLLECLTIRRDLINQFSSIQTMNILILIALESDQYNTCCNIIDTTFALVKNSRAHFDQLCGIGTFVHICKSSNNVNFFAVYSRVSDKPTPIEQENLYRIMSMLVRHANILFTFASRALVATTGSEGRAVRLGDDDGGGDETEVGSSVKQEELRPATVTLALVSRSTRKVPVAVYIFIFFMVLFLFAPFPHPRSDFWTKPEY